MPTYELWLKWPGNRWGAGIWNLVATFPARDPEEAHEKARQKWQQMNQIESLREEEIEFRIVSRQTVAQGNIRGLEEPPPNQEER